MRYVFFAFATSLMVPCAGVAGSISGTVKGADGSSVTGGVVTAHFGTGAVTSRFGRTSVSVAIRPDGTFQLAPLGEGGYGICVEVPSTIWLGSCEWGNKGTSVSLTQSQPSATISVVLTKGAAVRLRVNDSAGLLTANEAKTPGAHLLVGVGMDNLLFRPAAIVSQDAAGRTYQVVVPFDRSVQISVASAHFQLSEVTGKALAKFGNLIPVLVPSGQQPPNLVLNVTGTSKP
jgi:hypothetical protein